MPAPAEFLQYVDSQADTFVTRLADAVKIQSVSGDITKREDVFAMANFLQTQLTTAGAQVTSVDMGKQPGEEVDLPPVLLAQVGTDPSKKTILCYGHYDVQPAEKSDGWNTEPFELTEIDGKLYGRGSTDDKGPILGWLNVIDAHKALGLELPVNLKMCLEGMEESGSTGLDDLIKELSLTGGFLSNVDAVCISDNYWLTTRKPCLTYGLRGVSYYNITISGPGQDLHSGMFGGTVFEPMTDLIYLMGKLVDSQGKILIPHIYDSVPPVTEEERKTYESMDFEISDLDEATGAHVGLSDDPVEILLGRMRYPSLSLHGIEGAFSGKGSKTVIPSKVIGKFSLRLVPDQTPELIDGFIKDYINEEFAKLNSRNTMTVELTDSGAPWVTDPDHPNYHAAAVATEEIYGVQPDLTREGGSIPVTLTFAESLGANVLLLPMGKSDDGAHSTNEKMDRTNFIEGTKLLGTYLYEVATAPLKN